MPEEIPEWNMIQELYEIIDELETPAQQEFVKNLFENIDPYTPMEDQLIGLNPGKQLAWLYSLYEKFVNGDEETAREYWDEE